MALWRVMRGANEKAPAQGRGLAGHSQEGLDAVTLQMTVRPRKRFGLKCSIEIDGRVDA